MRFYSSLLLALALSSQAYALDLGGFTLGTPAEAFEKDKTRFACEMGRTAFAEKTCRLKDLESVKVGTVGVEFMTFMFLENRLYAVTANFNPAQFGAVADTLSKKYGAPKTQTVIPSTAAKATGLPSNESDTLEWRAEGFELLLRRANMVGRSDIRLWSPKALDKAVQALSKK